MNKERRKKLTEICDQISELSSQLEAIAEEEQEYLDGMPTSFEEKSEQSQGYIDSIYSEKSNIDDAVQNIIDEVITA